LAVSSSFSGVRKAPALGFDLEDCWSFPLIAERLAGWGLEPCVVLHREGRAVAPGGRTDRVASPPTGHSALSLRADPGVARSGRTSFDCIG